MATSQFYVQLTHNRMCEKFVTAKTTVMRQHLINTIQQLKIDSESIIEKIPSERSLQHHTQNLKYENKLEYQIEDITIQITKTKFIQRLKDL